MAHSLIYFAYGSNLHPARLGARIPSARFLGVAHLPGFVLRFHKRGGDGSAKCDAWYAPDTNAALPGAIYEMAASDKPMLDGIEGPGYRVDTVSVEMNDQSLQAFCYFSEMEYIDSQLKPFSWYKELVWRGAKFHRFNADYLTCIESVTAIQDPDDERLLRNLRVIELM